MASDSSFDIVSDFDQQELVNALDQARREIAALLGRSPAQVTLRWHLQRGDIIFPKSMHRERMQENLEIFDFELSAEEMATLDGLDKGEPGRTGPNPDTMTPRL